MVMQTDSKQSLPCECLILDRFYIGDFKCALQVLSSDDHLGVTHMLSLVSSSILSSMCRRPGALSLAVTSNKKGEQTVGHFEIAKHGSPLLHMVVPLLDSPEEDILQVMQSCFEFIDEGRKQGTVLVHCMAGKSRSAAVVAGYLMWSMGLSLKQAMETVNRNYKKASPNSGYMRQLERLEMLLCKNPKGLTEFGDIQPGLLNA